MASPTTGEKDLNLRTICDALGSIELKWLKIGVQLGIPRNKLDEFRGGQDPLSAVVDYWLRGNTDVPVSWKTIEKLLKSEYVGEPGIAERIRETYCQKEVTIPDQVDGGASSKGTEGKIDPAVLSDLECILEQNTKEIGRKYAAYVDSLRSRIEAKGVSAQELQSYLLSLIASNGQELTLLSNKKPEIEGCTTVKAIFNLLTTKCASFLNYDIFQSILEYYKITMDIEELKYQDHLKAYLHQHKISKFFKINPKLKKKYPKGTEKLILKCDIKTTCKLAKVVELKKVLAEILGVIPSALEIVDIKDGCVLVLFRIPASVGNFLFVEPSKELSSQQQDKFRAASVKWVKYRGQLHFGKEKTTQTRPDIECMKQSLFSDFADKEKLERDAERIRKRPIHEARTSILTILNALREASFKAEVGLIADEMFVGGSVGQGTTIPGYYDLDLVIYSRSIDPTMVVKTGYDEIQDKLESYLWKHLSPHYRYHDRTHVAVKFTYKQLEVDLLLSPYWNTREEYYTSMRKIPNPRDRYHWFSTSLLKHQTNFIKNIKHTGKVHELIRRAKTWKNAAWKDDSSGEPSSYLLSLLIITAFDRLEEHVKTTKKFKSLAGQVAKEMKELVRVIATSQDLDLVIPGTKPEVLSSDLLCSKPRIIDPVNPVNNLYLSGVRPNKQKGEGRWEVFKDKVANFDISIPSIIL